MSTVPGDATTIKYVTQWPEHKPRIYGHVHMAKTAGSEINGELAARFERVCGHKGYSYDAYQLNQRNSEWKKQHPDEMLTDYTLKDLTTKMVEKHNRGRVHMDIQREIGYEDCDYISGEVSFSFWNKLVVDTLPNNPPIQLELHVPCRDPVDWLMSMCNHQNKNYNCNAETVKQGVEECLFQMNRFQDISLNKNIHLKCFDPIPIESYIEYMGSILQPRRFVATYVHKDTNSHRNKTEECIHSNEKLKVQVEQYLVENVDVFRFCNRCIGSENDLFWEDEGEG